MKDILEMSAVWGDGFAEVHHVILYVMSGVYRAHLGAICIEVLCQ